MRVLLGAFGTRGDVQPMLALSEALLARGHPVELAVPPSSLEHARQVVPDAFAVGLNYEEVSRRASSGSMRDMMATIPLVRGEIDAQLQALEARAAGADVIAGSSVCMVGTTLGEALGKPYAFFSFCPQIIPSGEHPAPAIRQHGRPAWLNRFTWWINELIWRRMIGARMEEVRRARGLPRLATIWGGLLGVHPVAAFDPGLATAPVDWPAPIPQVGALFAREREELSADVSAFLERGPPPVYVGFGSMSDPDPRATVARIIESARRAGVRALISRGWAGFELESPPPEVLFIGPQPHRKLFPRCAAVVHHGGAGTTHAAAHAGVPQVVMPHLLDQFYWAHRVKKLGIGRSVARYRRSPEPLARAIRECVEDAGLLARARALGERIQGGGAERAVEVLERLEEEYRGRRPRLRPGSAVSM